MQPLRYLMMIAFIFLVSCQNVQEEAKVESGHSSDVLSVAFSPDGKLALSGSRDTTLKLWEVSTGRELRTFNGHSSSVESVAFSPDGKLALSGSDDKTMNCLLYTSPSPRD